MNWWWNDRRPSIVKTIDLFKKSLPLKLTSPSAIDREEAKSIVRDLELYESLIKEIDAAFNKTKKPRAPYCPYNGCNTIKRTRLSVSIQCPCNKTLVHHSYNRTATIVISASTAIGLLKQSTDSKPLRLHPRTVFRFSLCPALLKKFQHKKIAEGLISFGLCL